MRRTSIAVVLLIAAAFTSWSMGQAGASRELAPATAGTTENFGGPGEITYTAEPAYQPTNRPDLINAVILYMANQPAGAALLGTIVVAHPWTVQERWDYTRSYRFQVPVDNHTWNVTGHVHYQRDRQQGANADGPYVVPAHYTAGPGRYWISNVDNWDTATPAWAVQLWAAISDQERNNATNSFNQTHPGANLPLR